MPLRDVFSPHCSSPCTPTTAPLKTPLSSSWSSQTTLQSLVLSRTVTSLLTDRRLSSWLSGAVLTTWSWTRSKQWRWSWTSGETPPSLSPLTIIDSTVAAVEIFKFLGSIISQDLKWDTHIDSIVKKAQQRLYFLRQLRKFNLPQELLKQFYSAVIESVLCTSITVWFGSATKSDIRRLQRTVRTAERIIGAPLPPSKNCIHPEWGKGLRKSLGIPHIQVIPFLNFCHLAGAKEPQIPGQPGTRTVSSPRQSTLWTVKCSPHYAIKMCNNLIFICYHLHSSTSLHLILFYFILSSIAQLYIQFNYFSIFVYLYLHMYIFLFSSYFYCLCVLVSVYWKLMSLKQIPCMRKHTWQ